MRRRAGIDWPAAEHEEQTMGMVMSEDEAASQRNRRALNQTAPERMPDGRAPLRTIFEGAYSRAEPADPAAHDIAALYAPTHGDVERDRLWDYMGYGPFADADAMAAWFAACAPCEDPLFFVLTD
jgi:hypothetical protein